MGAVSFLACLIGAFAADHAAAADRALTRDNNAPSRP